MQDAVSERKATGLRVGQVDILPEYVLGFPIYVAITVEADADAQFNRLRFARVAGLRDSIGLEIEDERSGKRSRELPRPLVNEDLGLPPEELAGGEARRMLTDVSPLFDRQLAAGSYLVKFLFAVQGTVAEAPAVTIRFREATQKEQDSRAVWAVDRERFPNWAMWSISCPATPVPKPSLSNGHPLQFSILLRHLFCGSEPLEKVDPRLFDGLDSLYAPEAAALRGELLQHQGRQVEYERLREATLAATPGLRWWFDMIDEDGAFLESFSMRPR